MLKRFLCPDAEAPVTEPLIVPDIVLDGIEVRGGRHVVKLIGIVTTPSIGRDQPTERRIVARFTVPIDAARALWADLADELREQGGYGDRRPEVVTAQFRDRAMDN
jgi:hypothetical protein